MCFCWCVTEINYKIHGATIKIFTGTCFGPCTKNHHHAKLQYQGKNLHAHYIKLRRQQTLMGTLNDRSTNNYTAHSTSVALALLLCMLFAHCFVSRAACNV